MEAESRKDHDQHRSNRFRPLWTTRSLATGNAIGEIREHWPALRQQIKFRIKLLALHPRICPAKKKKRLWAGEKPYRTQRDISLDWPLEPLDGLWLASVNRFI